MQDEVWRKMTSTWHPKLRVCGFTASIPWPKLDDVKLLALCLAWLPGVFVSDVTTKDGALPGGRAACWQAEAPAAAVALAAAGCARLLCMTCDVPNCGRPSQAAMGLRELQPAQMPTSVGMALAAPVPA